MGRDQPTLSIETLSKNNQETSRKMKSTFTILIAVLAIVSVSSKVLLPGDFSAKNDELVVTTEKPTDGPTEPATTTPAPTEPTEPETTTPAPTGPREPATTTPAPTGPTEPTTDTPTDTPTDAP